MAQPQPAVDPQGGPLPQHGEPPVTTYRQLFSDIRPAAPIDIGAYLGGYRFQEEGGRPVPAPAGLRDQTVHRCDRMPMTFMCLTPRRDSQVVQIVHRFMRYLDLPGEEPTGLDDTVIGLLGDIRPGMLPVVEIPGSVFHLTTNQVRALTNEAMRDEDRPEPGAPVALLGPYQDGALNTEVIRPRNVQLLPCKYAPLILDADGLHPLRAYYLLREAFEREGDTESCRDALIWLRAASIPDFNSSTV